MGDSAVIFGVANRNAALAGDRCGSRNAHLTVVVDGHLFNRDELSRRLSLPPDRRDDAETLAGLWLRYGRDCLQLALGDFAALIFDARQRELVAWLSAGSGKHLFCTSQPLTALAASTPWGVLAHPSVERKLNFGAAAGWAASLPSLGDETFFKSVRRVVPGQAVSLSWGSKPQEIWRFVPKQSFAAFQSICEAGEALRCTLDLAVQDRLAPTGEVTSAQLSSGRDSAAVAVSAARVLGNRGESLLAFTGIPAGDPPAVADRVANESVGAARVAATAANIDHVMCSYEPGSFISRLTELHQFCSQPLGNVANMPWWTAILDQARARGAKVLLTGGAGNFTISAGGRDHINDVVLESGWAEALRLAWATSGRDPRSWLGSSHALFGPFIPRGPYLRLLAGLGRFTFRASVPILREPYRGVAERRMMDTWPDPRPNRSGFAWRAAQLSAFHPGDLLSREMFGIKESDPTFDPRLVQLTLSVPPAFLLPRPGNPRPLYTAAFGSRLPQDILRGRKRGYQGADWDRQFPINDVYTRFEQLLSHPLNETLFDREFILSYVRMRPRAPADLVSNEALELHRNMLLGALSIADWISVHFPDR